MSDLCIRILGHHRVGGLEMYVADRNSNVYRRIGGLAGNTISQTRMFDTLISCLYIANRN